MPATWSHPRLGMLVQDDIWWRRQVALPSFKSFTYIDAAVRAYCSKPEPFELVLQCESETELPNEEMAALAAVILDSQWQLVPKLLKAIWADLNGRGPDSGMWWHGDLPNAHRGGNWTSEVNDLLVGYELPVPAAPEDLRKVLQPKYLTIRRDLSPPGPWIGEFNFHSGFDVEHGVGVLTDGVEILGIGYSSDATRFKE